MVKQIVVKKFCIGKSVVMKNLWYHEDFVIKFEKKSKSYKTQNVTKLQNKKFDNSKNLKL